MKRSKRKTGKQDKEYFDEKGKCKYTKTEKSFRILNQKCKENQIRIRVLHEQTHKDVSGGQKSGNYEMERRK